MNFIDVYGENLFPPCPLCGGKFGLKRRTNGQFQSYCCQCGVHSFWGKKTDVVVDWFLRYLHGQSYTKSRASIKAREI